MLDIEMIAKVIKAELENDVERLYELGMKQAYNEISTGRYNAPDSYFLYTDFMPPKWIEGYKDVWKNQGGWQEREVA